MPHKMKLQSKYFDKIVSLEKIIESRLCDDKRRIIKVDDEIEFTDTNDVSRKCLVRVVELYKFNNFEELFSAFLPEYFGGESKEGLLEEIEVFYSKEDQSKYGVLGIKIQVINE